MCHKIGVRACLTLAMLTLSAAVAADEQEEQVDSLDRTPVDCISTNRIRDTDVVDERTIVFRLRGGEYFSNILERDCPGLDRHERFMHETRGGRLCDIDTITVLEQWAGRISQGFTCSLGQFHPITEIEAQDLLAGPDAAAAESNDIEVREVELPPGEEPPPADDE